MKQLTVDFKKCPGEKYCNACEPIQPNLLAECRKKGSVTFKSYGWAEAQIVTKLIARCPHNAIVVTG